MCRQPAILRVPSRAIFRIRSFLMIATLVLSMGYVLLAQVEASFEGPISNIELDGNGTSVNIMADSEVTDFKIQFTPGMTEPDLGQVARRKTIHSPTVELTPQQLSLATPLPGRSQPGFIGGTIIAEGKYDVSQKLFLADFIHVEPSENVILGALTRNDAGTPRQLAINGIPIEMLTDPRIPANEDDPANPIYLNQYGFAIKIASALLTPTGPTPMPPPPSSAEGYLADGKFYAFVFEYGDTGTLEIDPAITPQISMERASYRDDGTEIRVEARGFVTTSHTTTSEPDVELFRVDFDPSSNQEVESPIDVADVENVETGFARWRIQFRGNKPGGIQSGAPLRIVVKNHSGIDPATSRPAFDETEPDIRED
jgi:hypothetical protein